MGIAAGFYAKKARFIPLVIHFRGQVEPPKVGDLFILKKVRSSEERLEGMKHYTIKQPHAPTSTSVSISFL